MTDLHDRSIAELAALIAARKLDAAELRREGPKARRSVVDALLDDRREGR